MNRERVQEIIREVFTAHGHVFDEERLKSNLVAALGDALEREAQDALDRDDDRLVAGTDPD